MSSMIYEEYNSRFLELLRYVPYLKHKKTKIQIFMSGSPVSFRDMIEFDEPISLEEAIWKLKNYYEKSKHRPQYK